MTGPLTLEFIDLDKTADCLMGEAIGRAARREVREKADSMVMKMCVPDDCRFLYEGKKDGARATCRGLL